VLYFPHDYVAYFSRAKGIRGTLKGVGRSSACKRCGDYLPLAAVPG
jgi:hypothetical protein